MAAHRWLARFLSVLLVVLFGQAGPTRADHFLTHPSAPGAQAPNARAGPQAVPRHIAAPPHDAEELFQSGVEVDSARDASVYITPRNLPKNDRYLKAYSAANARRTGVGGDTVPGLLGIAAQTYRANVGADGKRTYSLADAMRDAVWRKNTSAKLKTLLSFRRVPCVKDAGADVRSPSVDFGSGC